MRAAEAGLTRDRATSDRLRAGAHEILVEAGGQRRSLGTGGPSEADWSVAIARSMRLPAKREADFSIGDRVIDRGRMAALDARHETSRLLLGGWFDLLRQSVGVSLAVRQVEVMGELADIVRRRMRSGDAARLEELQAQAALSLAEGQLQLARQRADAARIALERGFPQLAGVPLPALDSDAHAPGRSGERAELLGRPDRVGQPRNRPAAGRERHPARPGRAGSRGSHPDPLIGVRSFTDRGREDRILGVFVAIPLPGEARVAAQREALALADEGEARAAATQRRVLGGALSAYDATLAGARVWQALAQARGRSDAAARLAARAFELGEGTLTDVLVARRGVLDATLGEQTARIDALEAHARLRLDAHLLWDFDED